MFRSPSKGKKHQFFQKVGFEKSSGGGGGGKVNVNQIFQNSVIMTC